MLSPLPSFHIAPLTVSRPKPHLRDISPTLSLSVLQSAQPLLRSNISHTVCQSGTQCPLKSVLPSRAPAQHWEVLPAPATGARIPVSEPGTLRTEDATYQKLSIISFQYTPLGNWGVTSSSPFSSYLQPLAATKNRYIISQKQENQERVLFDLLNLL